MLELASDIGVCVCVSGTSTCAMVACYGELRSLSTAATSLAWLGCCWVMSDHLNLGGGLLWALGSSGRISQQQRHPLLGLTLMMLPWVMSDHLNLQNEH